MLFWFPSDRMTSEGASTRVLERLVSFILTFITLFLWSFVYAWFLSYYLLVTFGNIVALSLAHKANYHSVGPRRFGWFPHPFDFERDVVIYTYIAHTYYARFFLAFNVYALVYVYCSELLYKILSFILFIVPFSYVVSAELSNEYLLFCSIFFTLILGYERFASFIIKSFDPALDSLRTSVSKKLVLLLEVSAYQEILLNQYLLTIEAFEELTALVSDLATSTEAADHTVFSQSLVFSVNESLHAYAAAEAQLASQLEFLELSEVESLTLDELISENFDDQSDTA